MNCRAMSKPASLLLAVFLSIALSACGASSTKPTPTETPPLAGASIGGPFTLVDKDGKTVRWSDFDGKYRIVYFGYTFCPDACPADVSVMMRGYAEFAKAHPQLAAQVQPLFISVDPARDTPKVVGEFAAAFSPKLMGLTGTQQEVDKAAKEFAVYHAKGQKIDGGYLVNHSRIAYLMGRKGEPISMLPVDKGPDAVAAELAKWVK
jgi:protein SCO1/2